MANETDFFLAQNESAIQEPRYVIEIDFDGTLVYFTSHDDAVLPPGTLAENRIDGVITKRGISGQTQKVDPAKAQHTIGNVNFKIVDHLGLISTKLHTQLLNDVGVRKRQIKLYQGHRILDSWDDYALRLTYLIDNLSYKEGVYKIASSDIQRTTKTTIFNVHTGTLTDTINADQLLIPVTIPDAANKFPLLEHDALYTSEPSQTVGYIEIDEEIIAHSGWSDGTFTKLQVLPDGRGALGTRNAQHIVTATQDDRKKQVDEYIYIEMATPRLIYAILTGSIEGQTGGMPNHWSLGIDTNLVTLSDFTGLPTGLWDTATNKGKKAQFMGTKQENAKDFIERELLLWIQCFMPVYSNGKYGIKIQSNSLPNSPFIGVLNENEVIDYQDLTYDQRAVINDIDVNWGWVERLDRFTKTTQLIDTKSITRHKIANKRTYEFKGVFPGAHTATDLENYFTQIRDRHSGPPMRIKVTCHGRNSLFQVGDPIRLSLPNVVDYNIDVPLDRTFEIQQVITDWTSGKVSFVLFGATEEASHTVISGDFVMADEYYTSAGTDLSSVLTIVGGAITANGTLNGGSSSRTVFYYDNDLTLNDGVTLTITGNVELRIRGSFQVNGIIDGNGGGHAGAVQANTIQNTYGTPGNLGYFGSGWGITVGSSRRANLLGIYPTPPMPPQTPVSSLQITNPDGLSLDGLINDMQGTSGSGGYGVNTVQAPSPPNPWILRAKGSDGGASGAGLVIVNRGFFFGPSGEVNLDGGANNNNWNTYASQGATFYGSPGFPGNAGSAAILIDGNSVAPGTANFSMDYGQYIKPPAGVIWDNRTPTAFTAIGFNSGQSYAIVPDVPASNQKNEHLVIRYIPKALDGFEWFPADVEEETTGEGYGRTNIPDDVSNFQALQNGENVVFRWDAQAYDVAYEIRYAPFGSGSWADATPLTISTKGTNITSSDISPGSWTFFIKGLVAATKTYSINASTSNIVTTSPYDEIVREEYAPLFPGTLVNLIVSHNKLVPLSQGVAADDDWDTFDVFVPNPYPTSTYDAGEIDIDFDDLARVYGEITSALGPGEVGVADPSLGVDHRLEAGVYDGYEPWSIGDVVLRYGKARVNFVNTNGIYFVSQFVFVVDQVEKTKRDSAVTVAPGGTLITFPGPDYHTIPFVKVFAEGAVALFPTFEAVTETTFIFHIWNNAGTDVGGTGSWESTGV